MSFVVIQIIFVVIETNLNFRAEIFNGYNRLISACSLYLQIPIIDFADKNIT